MSTGRPSKYTEELAAEICELVVEGNSLRAIGAGERMPSVSTIVRWLSDDDKTSFQAQYAGAKEAFAEVQADEIVAIADDANSDDVQIRKLRIDARKWVASKLLPRKYGDRQRVQHANDPDNPMPEGTDNRELAKAVVAVLERASKP